jgi:hypothetical protein
MPKKTKPVRETGHGTRTMKGKCRDCAHGMLKSATDGFEYWDQDSEGNGFWFCRYCGSNHVTISLSDGSVIEQGDLYG